MTICARGQGQIRTENLGTGQGPDDGRLNSRLWWRSQASRGTVIEHHCACPVVLPCRLQPPRITLTLQVIPVSEARGLDLTMRAFDRAKDYYQALGVDRRADLEQIKRAYRARARASHPDLGGKTAAMIDLNEAYEILSDPATRQSYDSERPFADEHRLSKPKPEPPVRTESLAMSRLDRDLLWLTSRAIICALLAVLWLLAVEEASPHRGVSVVVPWLMRGLGIVTLGVGILFGYAAHRLAQQKMSHRHLPRPEKQLSIYKSIFRALIGFLILTMYLSK